MPYISHTFAFIIILAILYLTKSVADAPSWREAAVP